MSTIVTANVKRPSGSPDNISTEYIVEGTLKAWVYGDSAASLNSSFNISSSTDHAQGDYSYDLTNGFSSTDDFAIAGSVYGSGSAVNTKNSGRLTATKVATEVFATTSGSNVDGPHDVHVSGNLA